MKKEGRNRNLFILLTVIIILKLILQLFCLNLLYDLSKQSELKGELATLNFVGYWESMIWDTNSPYYGKYCKGGILSDSTRITTACKNPSTGEWYDIPYCGDGSCNGEETYNTCPNDCAESVDTGISIASGIPEGGWILKVVDESGLIFTSSRVVIRFNKDLVNLPSVKLMVKKGCNFINAIDESRVNRISAREFSYPLIPGVELITRDPIEYGDFKDGYLDVSGAVAIVDGERGYLVGNKLAEDVDWDVFHKDFWYYPDPGNGYRAPKNGVPTTKNSVFTAKIPYYIPDCDTCKVADNILIPSTKIQWYGDETPEKIKIRIIEPIRMCHYFRSPTDDGAEIWNEEFIGKEVTLKNGEKKILEAPPMPGGSYDLELSGTYACTWTDTDKSDSINLLWSPGGLLYITDEFGNWWFSQNGLNVDCNKYIITNSYYTWKKSYNPPCIGGYKGKVTVTKCDSSDYYDYYY